MQNGSGAFWSRPGAGVQADSAFGENNIYVTVTN